MNIQSIALLTLIASALTASAQNSTRVDFIVDKASETITVTFSGTYLLNQTDTKFYYVKGGSGRSSLYTENGSTTTLAILQPVVYHFYTLIPYPD